MIQHTIPYVAGSATSRAAAQSMEPTAGTLEAEVYELLVSYDLVFGGLTDEEAFSIIHARKPAKESTIRARRVNLVAKGLVRDSGTTRKTASGRQAVVWMAT